MINFYNRNNSFSTVSSVEINKNHFYNIKKFPLSSEVTRNNSTFYIFNRIHGFYRNKSPYNLKIKKRNKKINKNEKIKNKIINEYKDTKLENDTKECTFFPKLNNKYNNKHVYRLNKNIKKKGKQKEEIKIINNNILENEPNDYDSFYNRNILWQNNISKRNNYINKDEEKYSFKPKINKKKNLSLIFMDNDYSDYWLRHNKHYIYHRLKFINYKENKIYLNSSTLRENYISQYLNNNKESNLLNLNNNKRIKININYIKRLLHEELQNTKSDDE